MVILARIDPTPLFLILVVAIGIASIGWHFRRSRLLLERWAERNGFTLISGEYRWLARGPFWWRTGKGQSVYRVEVRDATGEYHTGYVRVGGWFLGLLSDAVSVEWDRPRSTHGPRGFPVVTNQDDALDDDSHR